MKTKKLFLLILAWVMSWLAMGCSGTEKGSVFLDVNGNELGRVSTEYGSVITDNEIYSDYLIVAMRETMEIICRKQGVSKEQAYEFLYGKNYKIYTKFNPDLQTEIYETMSEYGYADIKDYAIAITDLDGSLVASFSADWDNENLINGSLKNRYPCSTIKPLSVYAPLIEEKKINWSSVQVDTYIQYVEDENGVRRKWPANVNGQYTEANVTVVDALKDSHNTVAVKWLQELTVSNSYEFLDKLGIDVEYERNLSSTGGNDEVLGNLAMGYLRQGVTAIDMAGYYQMFANGGTYLKPTAVSKICQDDKELYHKKTEQKQIIKPVTAYIMNKLLCNVVTSGTGKEAQVKDMIIGGKTGTSTGNADNWFVGFSPEYSCAIWHDDYFENVAPRIFSNIFTAYSENREEKIEFPACEDVNLMAYCIDSGGSFTEKCRRIDSGYYLATDQLDPCNIHK